MRLAGEGGSGFQISDLRFQIGLLVVWDSDKWRRAPGGVLVFSYCPASPVRDALRRALGGVCPRHKFGGKKGS